MLTSSQGCNLDTVGVCTLSDASSKFRISTFSQSCRALVTLECTSVHIHIIYKNKIGLTNTLEDPAMAICPNGVISASWQCWLGSSLSRHPQRATASWGVVRQPTAASSQMAASTSCQYCVEKSELWRLEKVFRKQLHKRRCQGSLLHYLPLFQNKDSKAIKLLCLNTRTFDQADHVCLCMIMYAQYISIILSLKKVFQKTPKRTQTQMLGV